MAFFKNKQIGTQKTTEVNEKFKVKDIYVITSFIISSCNDGMGYGPRVVTWYFLAKCGEDKEYYELFSGRKLKKERKSENGCLVQKFDIPYIEKVEPLKEYLKNENKITITGKDLFDFILIMNVNESILKDAEDDEDEIEEE